MLKCHGDGALEKVFEQAQRISSMTTEQYQRKLKCQYCGADIFFDDKIVSPKTGKKFPLDCDTGDRHRCQEYFDAMERLRDEKIKREHEAYRRRSKENIEQFKRERPLLRKDKIRSDKAKTGGSAISVNEEPDSEKLLIEYRPPDFREW